MSTDPLRGRDLPWFLFRGTNHQSVNYLDSASRVFPGILLAGMIYPSIATSITITVIFLGLALRGKLGDLPVSELSTLFVLVSFIGAGVGVAFAALSGWFSALSLNLFFFTLGRPVTRSTFVRCTGFLSGYLPLALFVLMTPWNSAPLHELWPAILIGPALAGLVGQWGAMRWFKREFKGCPEDKLDLSLPRFRISQILILTAWFGLAFSVCRVVKDSNFSVLLIVYVILQTLCLGIAKLCRVSFQNNMSHDPTPPSIESDADCN